MSPSRRLLGCAVLVAAAVWMGCSPSKPPDVVLVTIDTLRADALGCYQSSDARTATNGPRTPTADALASEGIVFENASPPLPETRPSHVSIFTSRYPREHGVMSNVFSLDDDALTLTEVYADAGYQTAAFTGCALLDKSSGLEQGFSVLDPPRRFQRPAQHVVPRAVRWLRKADPARPLFLWVHLFDPHMPYEAPAPAPGPDDGQTAPRGLSWPEILAAADAHGGDLPAAVLAQGLELYAAEVANADHWTGVLFAELRKLDRWSNTVAVLTSDHGECFGNGVYFEHSNCLYDGAMRIPLVLRLRDGEMAGQRIARQVENIDIAPTLLRLSGLPIPPSFGGRDLLREAADGEPRPAFLQHPLYRRYDIEERQKVMNRMRSVAGEPTRPILGDHEMTGARTPRFKYLVSGADEELYDLTSDPTEQRNLATHASEFLAELRRETRAWRRLHPLILRDPGEIDPTLREQLEALGYL